MQFYSFSTKLTMDLHETAMQPSIIPLAGGT